MNFQSCKQNASHHGFSTKIDNSISRVSSQRSFHQYRKSDLDHSQRKAYNMNDRERRIKRDYTSLYKKSTQESDLFEKGVKKVEPKFTETSQEKNICRTYRNHETYDILKPSPIKQNKLTVGGVKRINLYDQTIQTDASKDLTKKSRKILKNPNQQSAQTSTEDIFLVKKLPNHKNNQMQWHNSVTKLQFRKKQNNLNKENINSSQFQEMQNEKTNKKIFLQKNKGNILSSESGLTLGKGQENIDFNQNYYQKEKKIVKVVNVRPITKCGFLTERHR